MPLNYVGERKQMLAPIQNIKMVWIIQKWCFNSICSVIHFSMFKCVHIQVDNVDIETFPISTCFTRSSKFQSVKAKKTIWFKGKAMTVYSTKCLDLCWYMNLHSPPLVLDLGAKAGGKFDKETFKYYTTSGPKMSFLVWPALRLHKGGPMLAKGVAQGK